MNEPHPEVESENGRRGRGCLGAQCGAGHFFFFFLAEPRDLCSHGEEQGRGVEPDKKSHPGNQSITEKAGLKI